MLRQENMKFIMKLKVITDTHGCEFPARWRHSPDCDVILHLGDFSNSGRLAERFFDNWKPTGVPLYFISGNHEPKSLCTDIEADYGTTYLDYSWIVLDDVLLVGLGGYDIFSTARKHNLCRFMKRFYESGMIGKVSFSILLTHEPPWPWDYEGEMRGNLNIREFIREFGFDLVLSGHWHEEKSRIEENKDFPPIFNPGTVGCGLQIDNKTKRWMIISKP